jgi:hypothetical protein
MGNITAADHLSAERALQELMSFCAVLVREKL